MEELICQLPIEGSSENCLLKTNWTEDMIIFKLFWKQEAWTGTMSNEEVAHFSMLLSMDLDDYLKICKIVLSCNGGESRFTYTIANEQFTWTKHVKDDMYIKYGFVNLTKTSVLDVSVEMMCFSVKKSAKDEFRIEVLKKEIEELARQNEDMETMLKKEKIEKQLKEAELYTHFMNILNQKKDRIFELEEHLAKLNLGVIGSTCSPRASSLASVGSETSAASVIAEEYYHCTRQQSHLFQDTKENGIFEAAENGTSVFDIPARGKRKYDTDSDSN